VNKLLPLAVMAVLSTAAARAEEPAQTAPPVAPVAAAPAAPPATAPATAPGTAPAKSEEKPASCDDALGVSRVAEVDTTGGALFGDQYPSTTLLQKGEVVLTFDDGPHPTYTKEILAALAAQCTKATFFNVGEMVKQFPDIAKQVQAEGHTIGTHTWSHPNLGSLSLERAKAQIESTITAENAILPNGVAPFFRFPYLSDPKQVRAYLASRNIAVFSTDVDSFDWRTKAPDKMVDNVLKGLTKVDRGIILFHDIHEQTVKALPTVLKELKSHGFKVVHLVPKSHVEVIAQAEPPKTEASHGGSHHRAHHYVKRRRYAKR
jgi:peptidoglycan-N-acetylglucosamine deacetylase